jgi:hypothetical protein
MIVEVEIPDEWPPGVMPVRGDATPDQLEAVFDSVKMVIHEAGLAT